MADYANALRLGKTTGGQPNQQQQQQGQSVSRLDEERRGQRRYPSAPPPRRQQERLGFHRGNSDNEYNYNNYVNNNDDKNRWPNQSTGRNYALSPGRRQYNDRNDNSNNYNWRGNNNYRELHKLTFEDQRRKKGSGPSIDPQLNRNHDHVRIKKEETISKERDDGVAVGVDRSGSTANRKIVSNDKITSNDNGGWAVSSNMRPQRHQNQQFSHDHRKNDYGNTMWRQGRRGPPEQQHQPKRSHQNQNAWDSATNNNKQPPPAMKKRPHDDTKERDQPKSAWDAIDAVKLEGGQKQNSIAWQTNSESKEQMKQTKPAWKADDNNEKGARGQTKNPKMAWQSNNINIKTEEGQKQKSTSTTVWQTNNNPKVEEKQQQPKMAWHNTANSDVKLERDEAQQQPKSPWQIEGNKTKIEEIHSQDQKTAWPPNNNLKRSSTPTSPAKNKAKIPKGKPKPSQRTLNLGDVMVNMLPSTGKANAASTASNRPNQIASNPQQKQITKTTRTWNKETILSANANLDSANKDSPYNVNEFPSLGGPTIAEANNVQQSKRFPRNPHSPSSQSKTKRQNSNISAAQHQNDQKQNSKRKKKSKNAAAKKNKSSASADLLDMMMGKGRASKTGQLDRINNILDERGGGEEHDLMRRFMIQQQGPSGHGDSTMKIVKGRQRVKPRKKRLSTLKKKVLQERLQKWKEANPQDAATEGSTDRLMSIAETVNTFSASSLDASVSDRFCVVSLQGFVQRDEVEDDDEYEEILSNLIGMAIKIGPVLDTFIPRSFPSLENGDAGMGENVNNNSGDHCPAFVLYKTPQDAKAACGCWDGFVIGGQRLQATIIRHEPFPSKDATTDDVSPTIRQQWRQTLLMKNDHLKDNSENNELLGSDKKQERASAIELRNVLLLDDFEDKDSLEESLDDIKSMAAKFGTVVNVEALKEESGGVVVIKYQGDIGIASSAAQGFSSMVIGGLKVEASVRSDENSQSCVVELRNILTEDDFDDEDCLQESLSDIRALASECGKVSNLQVNRDGNNDGKVLITFLGNADVANRAVQKFSGMIIGGLHVLANVVKVDDENLTKTHASSTRETSWIALSNVLTEDDIEDEDCLNETKSDVSELAKHYGTVLDVVIDFKEDVKSASSGIIKIQYDGNVDVATAATEKLNGMVIGGQIIRAYTVASEEKEPQEQEQSQPAAANNEVGMFKEGQGDNTTKPIYSGNKLISGIWAEAKRVPKIPNQKCGPRHYATLSKNGHVKPLLIEMLGELVRLQRRAMHDDGGNNNNNATKKKNAMMNKARRRLVMGLREVARGIRAHKVKMVVMANNLDEYGVIDEKLQNIIDLCKEEGLPIFYEFSKRNLGKAVCKSIKVAVVGIQNADGAHQQFKKLNSLYSPM